MAEGRSKVAWSHTSAVLALIANVNRDPKRSTPFKPDDFNPHASKGKSATLPKVKMKSLKNLLMGLKQGPP